MTTVLAVQHRKGLFYATEDKMVELKELLEQFICERIQDLVGTYSRSEIEKKHTEEIDSALQQFSPEIRSEIEELLCLVIAQGSEEEEFLYVEGLKDGFRLFKELIK